MVVLRASEPMDGGRGGCGGSNGDIRIGRECSAVVVVSCRDAVGCVGMFVVRRV